MNTDPIKCDICGRFVSFDDLESGRAERHLLTPDSDYSTEEYDTYHLKCERKTQREMHQLVAQVLQS